MFSLIIVYSEQDETRREAFLKTVSCVEAQTLKPDEFIVIEPVWDKPSESVPKSCRHLTVDHSFHSLMNKSWLINRAVKVSTYRNLIISDADIVFGSDFFRRIIDFSSANKFFQCYSRINIEAGRDNPEPRSRTAYDFKTAGGVWFVDKEFFWQAGGMNESYFGYGGEDQDFWDRARHLAGDPPFLDYELTHTYHHWHTGHYTLNEHRAPYLYRTNQDLTAAIEKLKSLELGSEKPRSIYV